MRKTHLWLAAAVVLVGATMLLSWMADESPGPVASRAAPARFPRALRHPEAERAQQRRVLDVEAEPGRPAPRELPPRRDPLLVALSQPRPGGTAVVVEANALTNSPVGQLLLDCLRAGNPRGDPLEALRQQAGVDVVRDLDRVAISDGVVLASGNFSGVDWDRVFKGAAGERYGEHGRMYTGLTALPGLATWRGEMVIMGDNVEAARAALDRLEGRGAPADPFPEEDTYGEIYGVLGRDAVTALLREASPELSERLRRAAERVELHVDAMQDVAITATVEGPDARAVQDLAKALGGVLSLARVQAQAEGVPELAELLDQARVAPGDAHFAVELALPLPLLEKHLGRCRGAASP